MPIKIPNQFADHTQNFLAHTISYKIVNLFSGQKILIY